MANILIVGFGGFIGSVARYLISGCVNQIFNTCSFPIGTSVVNVSGCLMIGILSGIADTRQLLNPEVRLFLLIGVLGGFTTFSTFGYETVTLLRESQFWAATGNVSLQVILGLAGVWLGLMASRVIYTASGTFFG